MMNLLLGTRFPWFIVDVSFTRNKKELERVLFYELSTAARARRRGQHGYYFFYGRLFLKEMKCVYEV